MKKILTAALCALSGCVYVPAAPYGYTPYPYDNPTGTYRNITPAANQGEQCREFTRRVRIDGHMEDAHGTACLQPDGTWKTVGN